LVYKRKEEENVSVFLEGKKGNEDSLSKMDKNCKTKIPWRLGIKKK
jgi:hypothetical protein